jgi:hypothetical protein
MKALKKLTELDKQKLSALQREVNQLRPGFLDDKTMAEWRSLKPEARRMKIHVRLSMARLANKELEGIYQTICPWWEPYRKGLFAVLLLMGLYVVVQLIGFMLVERVYLKDLLQDITYTDSITEEYDLFDNRTMILRISEEGSMSLEEDKLVGWLTGKSRKAEYDSTLWTTDQELSDGMKRFYASFEGNSDQIRKVQGSTIRPWQVYQAVKGLLGSSDFQMDLDMPEAYRSSHVPFKEAEDLMIRSFFCSVREGEVFKNLKIDFTNYGVQSVRPVYYPPKSVWEQQKLIWFSAPGIIVPKFSVLNASGSIYKNYFIPLTDSIARPTN